MVDRRTRFREYMRRFDPTSDPAQAIANGFYVQPPHSVSARIATRIELEPASSELVVGGVGSGKTTELIVIEQKLAQVDDLRPIRVDVPSRHRLDKIKPGVLSAIAGIEACAELKREKKNGLTVEKVVDSAVTDISHKSKGFWTHPDDSNYDDWDPSDEAYWVSGILEEPKQSQTVADLGDSIATVQEALRRKVVVLFDGLDRIADLKSFLALVAEDIPALKKAGVAVVVVGPQHIRFSGERSTIEGAFDNVHLHGAARIDGKDGLGFLMNVLRARADIQILPDDAALKIVDYSGGLLRDLVALARAAGAEAYANGAEIVESKYVEMAGDRFGRDLIWGCTAEMSARLKKARRQLRSDPPVELTIATEVDQRLLAARLIIEVPGAPARYIIHPTVAPLISGLGAS